MVFFLLFVGCHNNNDVTPQGDEEVSTNNEIVQNKTISQNKSNINANDDLIQQQYRDSYFGLHSKRLEVCRKLRYNKDLLKIHHHSLSDTARREAESVNKEIDNNKSLIENIESEMQKVKLDMLKYYQGKPPENFYKDWTESDDKYNILYRQCVEEIRMEDIK
jgi:hypothetical protein